MSTRRREYLDLVADFETTTDPEDCRVWAWGLADVSDVPWFKHGNSLPSFINMLASFDSYVYFHNLAFDMYFILNWLLNNGFEHTTGKVRRNTFSTLIDRMGKAYTIDVMWNTGRKTQFRDSLKRIPMPVRDIATTFGLPIMKGEIDYHTYREPGHNLTGEEVEYLKNDVHIVAMALDIQKREGMTKLTVGSDALHSYKTLGQGDWFRQRFPLLDRDWDAEIRKAYRGGFTYADPRFQGRILGEGNVYDVNSLYPSVMQQKPIPWGVPQRFNTLAEAEDNMRPDDFCVTNIVFGATLKPDRIPCIQVKGSSMYQATEYQSVIEPGTDMWACNVDLQLWREQYDMDIEVAGVTYVFRTETGLFNDYIERWGEIKRNSFGGRRAIAKLFLRPSPTVFTGSLRPTRIAPVKYLYWTRVWSDWPPENPKSATPFTQRQAWQLQLMRVPSPCAPRKRTTNNLHMPTQTVSTWLGNHHRVSILTRHGSVPGSMRATSHGHCSPAQRRIQRNRTTVGW